MLGGESNEKSSDPWIDLFNGRDLTGWTPKFSGHPLGENLRNTFAVEDSLLIVSYEDWDSLSNVFGHLFYETPYSSYVLEAEYRFIGEQVAGGPGWAFANNGLMLHCQDPSTMTLQQDFPLSLEFQFLGAGVDTGAGAGAGAEAGAEAGAGVESRPTGNLCTPGCHVVIDDEIITDHCLVNFDGPTIPLEQWVRAEAVVYSDSIIHHVVNGDTVLSYQSPRIGGELGGLDKTKYTEGTTMSGGYVAIQAESHPIEFRSIRLKPLR